MGKIRRKPGLRGLKHGVSRTGPRLDSLVARQVPPCFRPARADGLSVRIRARSSLGRPYGEPASMRWDCSTADFL